MFVYIYENGRQRGIQRNRALLVLPHAFPSSPPGSASLEFSIRSDRIHRFTIRKVVIYDRAHIIIATARVYILCTTWTAACCDVHAAGGGGTDKLSGPKFVRTAQPMASPDNSARVSPTDRTTASAAAV